MLKAVILDFDGLIVDTEVVWFDIYVDWFQEKFAYEMTVEEFLTCVGSNAEELFRKLDDKGIHVDRDMFAQDTHRQFIERSSTLPVKDGVTEFLHAARARGVKVALATSSARKKPETHLTRLGLLADFDLLVTAEDVTRIKPFPDLFLTAAERLGVAPAECLVVEDSLNGLKAGQNAGMRVLVVPNDVTKYCTFEGDLRLCESLAQVDFDALMADF